jgi:hypothetical protein
VTRRLLLPLVVLVIAPLIVLPPVFGARQDTACVPTALPVPSGAAIANLDAEQLANAAAIVVTAARMGLDDSAATIGVMTALTESSLRNVAHGDAAGPDSRGLFQQRAGWGPLDVRMDPSGAARLFFDALVAVPHWQAQAVQRSAFSDGKNYTPSLQLARQVVAALRGTTAGEAPVDCAWPTQDGALLPGAVAAVDRARALVGRRGYYRLWARLASHIWGRTNSGYASAAEEWEAMVVSGNAHLGDRHPPVGALLFWDTDGPFGHVAVYVGGGQIVSNDVADAVPGEGGVYLVDVSAVETRWGATYLGWAPPIYSTAVAG